MKALDKSLSYDSFLGATPDQRTLLCAKLAVWMNSKIRSGLPNGMPSQEEDFIFREIIDNIIDNLKDLGHPLWRWDFSSNFEAWGYDYSKEGSVGLVLWIGYDDYSDKTPVEASEVYWHDGTHPSEPTVVK